MVNFTKRETKPTRVNLEYVRKSKGGWSQCCVGNPTDSECDALANCVGYACGRFNEIYNEITGNSGLKYPYLNCNAEQFPERVKQYYPDLQMGSIPKLGSIICWSKGNASLGGDGAGHVEVVEDIIDEHTIRVSGSSYGGQAFYTATRTYNNGNWVDWSGYKFRCFIYNPAVVDVTIEPVERNKYVPQIQVDEKVLRMRTQPNLQGAILGFCPVGIYNIYDSTIADGYDWYKIDRSSEIWIAGVTNTTVLDYETWDMPQPVERNKNLDQLFIGNVNLRIREKPSTDSTQMGLFVSPQAYYNVLDKSPEDDYTWYKLGENAWVLGVSNTIFFKRDVWEKPQPVQPDETKNQVFIGDLNLRIRESHSTKSQSMDLCQKNSYYDVLDASLQADYTWYKIGTDAWIAGVDGVIYYEIGYPRNIEEIKQEIVKLQSNLNIPLKALSQMKQIELYDELLSRSKDFNTWIDENFEKSEWDYIDENNYNEIDLIYTTDIHGYWKGYEDSKRVQTMFSMDDLKTYQNKLLEDNVKGLLVNCGDIIHGGERVNQNYGADIIKKFNDLDFFASVFGNHEFRFNSEGKIFQNQVPKINSMTACNLLYKNSGELVFKPYRLAKIGNTKIGMIGVGFPSLDAENIEEYKILTDNALYMQVQKYIDELKELGMDYIFILIHHGSGTDARSGGNLTNEKLINNISGADLLLPGHSHAMTSQEYYTDKSGKKVAIAAQPRCDLAYISRVRITKDGITSELINHI